MKIFIQISDCHIDDKAKPMGIDACLNLSKIVREISALKVDKIIITGDLSHNGTLESYKLLQEALKPIKTETVVIAGNHDNIDNLNKVFASNLKTSFKLGNWEIITTNSVKKSKTSGYLTKKELTKLDNNLNASSAKYNIITLHHPVVPMLSAWDDKLSLENSKQLFKVITKYPKIKAIIFGHAHEAKEFDKNGIKIISCPATSKQFNSENRIGFNFYKLYDNGKLVYYTKWLQTNTNSF